MMYQNIFLLLLILSSFAEDVEEDDIISWWNTPAVVKISHYRNNFPEYSRIAATDGQLSQYHAQILQPLNNDEIVIFGGVGIHERFILTVAHAFYNQDRSTSKIYMGSTKFGRGFHIKIKDIYFPDEYISAKNDFERKINDIALIFLDADTPLSPNNCLQLSETEECSGQVGAVVGFGTTQSHSTIISEDIQTGKFAIDGFLTNNNGTKTEFYTARRDVDGDSGSPFIVEENSKSKVMGIQSRNTVLKSNHSFVTVYIPVHRFQNWLTSKMSKLLQHDNICWNADPTLCQ